QRGSVDIIPSTFLHFLQQHMARFFVLVAVSAICFTSVFAAENSTDPVLTRVRRQCGCFGQSGCNCGGGFMSGGCFPSCMNTCSSSCSTPFCINQCQGSCQNQCSVFPPFFGNNCNSCLNRCYSPCSSNGCISSCNNQCGGYCGSSPSMAIIATPMNNCFNNCYSNCNNNCNSGFCGNSCYNSCQNSCNNFNNFMPCLSSPCSCPFNYSPCGNGCCRR
ncbi:hypothetical protein PENTCL1PPCAC_15291, partial [Pristionchus entomophagus]